LEAWGSDTNLFSQGSAHVVTDPKLMKVPLEHPGQVVKVLRASEAEQLAALDNQQPRPSGKSRKAEVLPKPSKKRPPKPSRTALTRAESALEKLEAEQAAADRDKVDEQVRALERRRRDLVRRQERERDEAQSRLDEERKKYEAARRRYESG
jgi:hypothetical protein